MNLETLLKRVAHTGVRGVLDRPVAGVVYDSRQVRPDYLFVAIEGEHKDGVAFVEDALRRGAGVVISPHGRFAIREATHVQVENARRALAEASDAFFGHPSGQMAVAGVTGTNGKTTTTFMIKDMLESAGKRPGLIGTVQYEVGGRVIPAARTTPESSDLQGLLDQMLKAGCQSVVMEVSSHALDQDRVHGVDFDVAVFTNLTRDHLDYHKTMDNYFAAKQKLFQMLGCGKRGVAVINADDPRGVELIREAGRHAEVVTFGLNDGAAVKAEDVVFDGKGSAFRIRGPWGECEARVNLLGRFNVQNALAAYTAGRVLGLDDATVLKALAGRQAVPGRLEEISTGRGFRVFVDYAHTDDALANVLETLRPFTKGRLIVVFGCGGNRDHSKRALMGSVASRLADFCVLTSDNPRREDPRSILDEIRQGFGGSGRYEVVEDRAAAIGTGLSLARDGDVVLIAGKGHECTQEFANTIVPFDDRQVARGLLTRSAG